MNANQGRRWHSAGWWASVGGIAGVVGTLLISSLVSGLWGAIVQYLGHG